MYDPRHPEEAESELVQQLQDGNLGAFDKLFERHRRAVFAYVAGMLRDVGLAEDIVQECFVEMVRHIGRIDPARGVRPWLFRVARNRAIDELRRHREKALSDRDDGTRGSRSEPVAPEGLPSDAMVEKERMEDLQQALDSLDAGDRDMLALRFYGDLTFREISKVLRRPLGTVLWQFPRTMERLRKRLKG